jgi:hypothetical protein
MTSEFLEQSAQRILGDRHREAGLRDRVSLGELTTLTLQGFEQNAARLALGVRLGCKGGISPHAPVMPYIGAIAKLFHDPALAA